MVIRRHSPTFTGLLIQGLQLAAAQVVAVFNAANPIVIATLDANLTTLTFQLVVNNGQEYSNPTFSSYTIASTYHVY